MHLLYHFAVLIAWGGGVAFVASLTYLVYFYFAKLGDPSGDPADRVAHLVINAALFALFALHHSLFARTRAKNLVTRIVPAHLERSLYVWTASALAILMGMLWQPIAGVVYRADGWLRLMLWGGQLWGALMVLQAARAMSALDLAGIRQAQGRGAKDGLRIVGPFRIVRHPIYLGWVLMVFATPTLTLNRLAFATVSTLYLILAIPWEEMSLVEAHGDQYRDYQRRVRWRLIPGVW